MKTKKISKQSLVIAVLSLLLVLSMGLYATGAYFTDSATTAASGHNLTFGTVAVNATYAPVTATTIHSYDNLFVPGDKYNYAGKVDPSASTVETYVLLKLQFDVTVKTYKMAGEPATKTKDKEYVNLTGLYDAATSGTNMLAFARPVMTAWASYLQTDYTNYDADDDYYLFKIPAGTTALEFTTQLELNANCPNVVYSAATSGEEIVLNIGNGPNNAVNTNLAPTIDIATTLRVASIQSKAANADITASFAYSELKTMVDAA